ncbi:MAG: CDP-diacylglycerol--glycerol-3-phosphate 3-phosphatidyltransferase [Rubrobacteridae bacterium]|nr:CDP-diacylglycerol--glycerol-3-phosphate 3-phosphatidyltransferase [Rubrobacteridae bacterium]
MKGSLNPANLLTLLRLISVPIFGYLAFSQSRVLQLMAALLFGLAALTDWLDGFIARKMNLESEFGAMLDPLVDRIFIISSLIILYIKASDVVPLWSVIILAGRDILMMAGWLFFKTVRDKRINVTYAGKVSTALIMISLFVVLFSEGIAFKPLEQAGLAIYYAGLILSIYTGIIYAFNAINGSSAGIASGR